MGMDRLSLRSNLQVFVVNLEKYKQRLTDFTANMKTLEVPFTRWVATLGGSLDSSSFGVKPVLPVVFVEEFEACSCNEAACGISHIRLFQYYFK